MKIQMLILLLLIGSNINSQDLRHFQKQVDSLEYLKIEYENRISDFEKLIKQTEDKILIAKSEKFGGLDYSIPALSTIQIKDKANNSGKIIFLPIKGETIKLIDFDNNNNNWLVSYNKNEFGYVDDTYINQDSSVSNYKNHLKVIKSRISLKVEQSKVQKTGITKN